MNCQRAQSLIAEAIQEIGASQRDDSSQSAPASGPKRPDPVHGFIFQLKLLMLFLHRGVVHQYSFLLGTEIKEAKKFDDLVFQYEQDGTKTFRLLQAKHKLDNTKNRITEDSLLTDNEGDFSLPKYFFSFRGAKKEQLFKTGEIKDITICTNINFSDDILQGRNIKVEKINCKDDILDIKIDDEVRPNRYRFSKETVSLLKPKLSEYIVKSKRLPPRYTDVDIEDFLNRLVLAVNCPNEEELGKALRADIGKDFDSLIANNMYNQFFVTMLEWLQGKEKGRFLSYQEGKEFFEEALKGLPIRFNVKNPVESFTGRTKELYELQNLLQGNTEASAKPVCVIGIGGVGKSELARMYIRQYCQTYDNKVVWIVAESFKTLSESFRELAVELRISTKDIDGGEKHTSAIVREVYRFFSNGRSLFVFDNAKYYRSDEELDDGLEPFLPSHHPGITIPHTLMTSRNQKWPGRVEVLKLDVLEEDEAVEFVSKALVSESDDNKTLARELQYFPLALQQAVAYIRVQDTKLRYLGSDFSPTKYIKKFREKTKLLLNFKFPEDSDNYYSKTIFVTWNVSLGAIEEKENGKDALEVFNILSYMAPDDIPTQIFLIIISDEDDLSSAFDLLQQYSMINVEGTVLSVHRLVQQITRIKLQEQNKEVQYLRKALKLLSENQLNVKNLKHAVTVWGYSSSHKELLKEFCWFSPQISSYLIKCGRYEEACSFGQSAEKSLIPLQSDNPTVFRSHLGIKNGVGVALQYLGEYDKALRINLELLPAYQNTYGPKHHLTLIIKSNLAAAYHGLGRNSEALQHHRDVLQLRRITLGEAHPHTLMTVGNIAKILLLEGSFKEASKVFRELHEIQEVVLGPNHPDTLETRSSLAVVTRRLGNYDECLHILQEISDAQEAVLEKSHPSLLHTKCCMAVALIDLGRSSEALNVFQDVLMTQKAVLGENHHKVLKTLFYIANTLQEQGRYDKSVDIFVEIYEKQKEAKGPYHPDTVNTQYCKGNALYYLGKYLEALEVYQEVLEKRRISLGNGHRDTLRARNSIAGIFLDLGEYDKALQQYLEVLELQKSGLRGSNLEILKDGLGVNHLDILDTKHDIGRTLVCKQEFDKALEVFCEVLDMFRNEMFPPDHADVLCVKLSLADVLSIQNKHSEALEICKEVIKSQEAILGKEHIDVIETRFVYGRMLLREGRCNEAFMVLREVLHGFIEALGPDHPKTQKINNTIKSIDIDIEDAAGEKSTKLLESISCTSEVKENEESELKSANND